MNISTKQNIIISPNTSSPHCHRPSIDFGSMRFQLLDFFMHVIFIACIKCVLSSPGQKASIPLICTEKFVFTTARIVNKATKKYTRRDGVTEKIKNNIICLLLTFVLDFVSVWVLYWIGCSVFLLLLLMFRCVISYRVDRFYFECIEYRTFFFSLNWRSFFSKMPAINLNWS